MTHTTVTYKGSSSQRLDMRWLSDAISQSSSSDAAKKVPIQIGNEKTNVGELFDIEGSFSNQAVALENSNSQMDYIGHALASDFKLTVNGDAGHFSGAELAGGKILIEGNTQDYTGCGMTKGLLEVSGNANDRVHLDALNSAVGIHVSV